MVRNQQVRGSNPLSSITLFRLSLLLIFAIGGLLSCSGPPEPKEILSFPEEFDISRTREHIIGQWGEPDSVTEDSATDQFDEAAVDHRYTLEYDGISFSVYDPAASDIEVLVSTVVTSWDYALDEGLQVGLSRERVREIYGEPDFVVEESELYLGDFDFFPPLNIEVVYEGDRVRAFMVYPDIP